MIKLVRMKENDFRPWLKRSIKRYAAENVRAGYWRPTEAVVLAQRSFSELLPSGLETKDQFLYVVYDSGQLEKVGFLWFGIKESGSMRLGFIYDILIDRRFRRKGFGRNALLALERIAKKLNTHAILLHMFAHNEGAKDLYEALGYAIKGVHMIKRLEN